MSRALVQSARLGLFWYVSQFDVVCPSLFRYVSLFHSTCLRVCPCACSGVGIYIWGHVDDAKSWTMHMNATWTYISLVSCDFSLRTSPQNSPALPRKSPISPQRNPTLPQKSTVFPQKSPNSHHLCLGTSVVMPLEFAESLLTLLSHMWHHITHVTWLDCTQKLA